MAKLNLYMRCAKRPAAEIADGALSHTGSLDHWTNVVMVLLVAQDFNTREHLDSSPFRDWSPQRLFLANPGRNTERVPWFFWGQCSFPLRQKEMQKRPCFRFHHSRFPRIQILTHKDAQGPVHTGCKSRKRKLWSAMGLVTPSAGNIKWSAGKDTICAHLLPVWTGPKNLHS